MQVYWERIEGGGLGPAVLRKCLTAYGYPKVSQHIWSNSHTSLSWSAVRTFWRDVGSIGVLLYEVFLCVGMQPGGKACIGVSVNLLKNTCEYLPTEVNPDPPSPMLTTSVSD